MEELQSIYNGVWQYITKVIDTVSPIWAGFLTLINYILFPMDAHKSAAIGLVGAVILDIITKYYAISTTNGGFRKAKKKRKIKSETFWLGVKRKIVSILVIMILAGLSIRITVIDQVAIILSAFAYSMMFWREIESIAENMVDAGHEEYRWLLTFSKRKRKELENNYTKEVSKHES